jgi:phospholipase D1/2
LSNAYTHNVDRLPHFPRTSKLMSCLYVAYLTTLVGLPYFKFLRKEASHDGEKMGRQEFARIQREVLENYLIDLIRAVV